MQAIPPVTGNANTLVPAGAQEPASQAGGANPAEVVHPVAVTPPLPPAGRDLEQTLADVAEHLRRYLQSTARDLEFHVDTDSHQAVIVVRDAAGQVIRQIPGEEAIRLHQRLSEGSGTFLNLIV